MSKEEGFQVFQFSESLFEHDFYGCRCWKQNRVRISITRPGWTRRRTIYDPFLLRAGQIDWPNAQDAHCERIARTLNNLCHVVRMGWSSEGIYKPFEMGVRVSTCDDCFKKGLWNLSARAATNFVSLWEVDEYEKLIVRYVLTNDVDFPLAIFDKVRAYPYLFIGVHAMCKVSVDQAEGDLKLLLVDLWKLMQWMQAQDGEYFLGLLASSFDVTNLVGHFAWYRLASANPVVQALGGWFHWIRLMTIEKNPGPKSSWAKGRAWHFSAARQQEADARHAQSERRKAMVDKRNEKHKNMWKHFVQAKAQDVRVEAANAMDAADLMEDLQRISLWHRVKGARDMWEFKEPCGPGEPVYAKPYVKKKHHGSAAARERRRERRERSRAGEHQDFLESQLEKMRISKVTKKPQPLAWYDETWSHWTKAGYVQTGVSGEVAVNLSLGEGVSKAASDFFGSAENTLADVSLHLKDLIEGCDLTRLEVDDLVKSIKNLFAPASLTAPEKIKEYVLIAIETYSMIKNSSWILAASIIDRLSRVFRVVKEALAYFSENAMRIFKWIQAYVSDSVRGEAGEGIFALVAMVVSCVGCFFAKGVPKKSDIDKVTNYLRNFTAFRSVAKDAISCIKAVIKFISPAALAWLCCKFPSLMQIEITSRDDVQAWIKRSMRYDTLEFRNNLANDPAMKLLVETDMKMAGILFSEADLASGPGRAIQSARDRTKKAFDWLQKVKMGDNGRRPEPFCILLTGPAGTGKSDLSRKLVALVMLREYGPLRQEEGETDEDFDHRRHDFICKRSVYPKNMGEQYWSGVNPGHFMCLMDDYDQSTADAATVNVQEMLIQLCSPNPYIMPMADVDDKGTYFTMPLVCLTSNEAYPDDKTVKSLEALYRRRNMVVEVTVHKDYGRPIYDGMGMVRSYMVDPKRVPKDGVSHLRFRLLDPMKNRTLEHTPASMTFKEFGYRFITAYDEFRAARAHNSLEDYNFYKELSLMRSAVDLESGDFETASTTPKWRPVAPLEVVDTKTFPHIQEGVEGEGLLEFARTKYLESKDFVGCQATNVVKWAVDHWDYTNAKRTHRGIKERMEKYVRWASVYPGADFEATKLEGRQCGDPLPVHIAQLLRDYAEYREFECEMNVLSGAYSTLSGSLHISLLPEEMTRLEVVRVWFARDWELFLQERYNVRLATGASVEELRMLEVELLRVQMHNAPLFGKVVKGFFAGFGLMSLVYISYKVCKYLFPKSKPKQAVYLDGLSIKTASNLSDSLNQTIQKCAPVEYRALMDKIESQNPDLAFVMRKPFATLSETCLNDLSEDQMYLLSSGGIFHLIDGNLIQGEYARQLNGANVLRTRTGGARAITLPAPLLGAEYFREGNKVNLPSKQKGPSKVPSATLIKAEADAAEMKLPKISRNVVYIGLISKDSVGGEMFSACHALGIADHVLAVPRHLFSEGEDLVENETMVVLLRAGVRYNMYFNRKNLIRSQEYDLAFYKCDLTIPAFVDIRHLIADQKQHGFAQAFNGLLVGREGTDFSTLFHKELPKVVQYLDYNYFATPEDEVQGKLTCNTFGYKYAVSLGKGKCGMPLVSNMNVHPNPIFGIHAAGGLDMGFSTPLIREVCEEAISMLCTKGIVSSCDLKVQEGVNGERKPRFRIPGNFEEFGYYDGGRGPERTHLDYSSTFEHIAPHRMEPSVLTPWDARIEDTGFTRSPLIEGVCKYGEPAPPLDMNFFEYIKESLIERFRVKVRPQIKRELTWDETINGIPQIPHMDSMNLGASAGLPWKKRKASGDIGKRFLFDINQSTGSASFNDIGEELRISMEEQIAGLRRGEEQPWLFLDCLKDELRSLAKVKTASTRVFTICPVDSLMIHRKFFLPFNAACMEANINIGFAAGLDPFSFDGHKIAMWLLEVGTECIAGDYKAFDANIHPAFFEMHADMVNAILGGDEGTQLLRRTLMEQMCHTYSVAGDMCYRKAKGVPSGFGSTMVINSEVGLFILVASFVRLAQVFAPELATPGAFWDHCRPIIMGDDFVLAKSPQVPWLTLPRLIEAVKEFGMNMTPEDKSDNVEDSKPLTRCSFLKCFLFQKEGIWRMALNKDTIYEMTNWISADVDRKGASADKARTALQYMASWGAEDFNVFRKKLVDAFEFIGIEEELPTFAECDAVIRVAMGQANVKGSLANRFTSIGKPFDLSSIIDEEPVVRHHYVKAKTSFSPGRRFTTT